MHCGFYLVIVARGAAKAQREGRVGGYSVFCMLHRLGQKIYGISAIPKRKEKKKKTYLQI